MMNILGRIKSKICGTSAVTGITSPDPFLVDFKRKFSGRTYSLDGKVTRVNVMMSSLDPDNVFGGCLGMLHLAKKFQESGLSVRILLTDQQVISKSAFMKVSKHDQQLSDFLQQVELTPFYSRDFPVAITKDDIFVATSWWTAHLAQEAVAHTDLARFIFFEQDYEPIFYEHSSYRVLAEQCYQFDYYPIFSTEILRNFFIAEGLLRADCHGDFINNPVLRFQMEQEQLSVRPGKRKLLFYGRPQPFYTRNLFALGCLAIDHAYELGYFREDEWEVISIGGDTGDQYLPSGLRIRHVGRFDLQEYKSFLPGHDVGMALMHSPHPGLLPFEMSAAGMLVVTNVFGMKNQDYFDGITSNILAVTAEYHELAAALIEQSTKVGNIRDRIAGSYLNWPKDWDEAIPQRIIQRAVQSLSL